MARAVARSPWDAVLAEAGTGAKIGQLYWDDRRLLRAIEAFFVNGGLDHAAVRLMEICRELAAQEPVSIVCAYRVAPKAGGVQPEFPEELAGLHSHLIPL